MSDTKHTPGPWKWREGVPNDLLYDHDVLTSSAVAVVYVESRDSCGNRVAREMAVCVPSVADARLIAAAPDLLAALKEMVEFDQTGKPADYAAIFADALSAIAKAEGR